jgi:hypothetical protein
MTNPPNCQPTIGRWFESDREFRVFIIAVCASFIAKGIAAVNGAFSVDDILFINSPFDGAAVKEVSFRDGRLLYPLFLEMLWRLGLDSQKSTSISFLVFTLCLVLTAQLACRVWKIEKDFCACLCVVLFATLHPYQADFLTWKIGAITSGIPLLLSLYGLWRAAKYKSRYSLAFGALCIAISLNIHQIGISWVAVTVCFSLIFALLRKNSNIKETLTSSRAFTQLLVMIFGIALYLLALIIFRFSSDDPAQSNALYTANLSSIASQASTFLNLIIYKNPFFTFLADLFFAFFLFSFLFICFRSIWNKNTTRGLKAGILASLSLAVLFAAISCAIFPTITLQKGQLFPRTMSALGLFWGALCAALIVHLRQKIYRKTLLGILSITFFVFIGINNQIFSEQIRANHRDIELGRKLINKITALEGHQFIERVAIIGTNQDSLSGLRFPLDLSNPQRLEIGIVMSIFANQYSNQYRVSLLNDALGGNFLGELDNAQAEEATSYCRYSLTANGKFPSAGSVVRSGQLAIVCL